VASPEDILRDGLEDAISGFGLLEATLRECRQEPIAEIVRQMKNKASAALELGTRAAESSIPTQPEETT
jgi:hypothetical protein